jgi:hypothetical protein
MVIGEHAEAFVHNRSYPEPLSNGIAHHGKVTDKKVAPC